MPFRGCFIHLNPCPSIFTAMRWRYDALYKPEIRRSASKMNLPSQARIPIKVWPQLINYLCTRCSQYATSLASPASGVSRSMRSADSFRFASKVLSAKHTASLRLLRTIWWQSSEIECPCRICSPLKGVKLVVQMACTSFPSSPRVHVQHTSNFTNN